MLCAVLEGDVVGIAWEERRDGNKMASYHPAASERLADSTNGVSRHGFLPVVVGFMAGCLTAGAL